MTWTKEKPRKSGFYGFRGTVKGYLKKTKTIVEVKLDACFGDKPYVWLLGTDESPELSLFEGEWYGPIEIQKDKRTKVHDFEIDGGEFYEKGKPYWPDYLNIALPKNKILKLIEQLARSLDVYEDKEFIPLNFPGKLDYDIDEDE